MPLPSPRTNDWLYNHWTAHFTGQHVPHLDTRLTYMNLYCNNRIDLLRNKIQKYRPKMIVFSGKTNYQYYNQITDTIENDWDNVLIGKFEASFYCNDGTLYVKTTAPNTRGLTNQYWDTIIAEIINRLKLCVSKKRKVSNSADKKKPKSPNILIPEKEIKNHLPLLIEIAEDSFGDNDKAIFLEEFVPPGGKVPTPKAENFSKKDLQSCAYYAGAGIDIQPILKFGDYISDFIYVSVGITKIQLIEGIEHCIKLANQNLINSSIKILNISDFKITDIEHKPENRLVSSLPDYFEEHQHRNYFENFSQFYNKRDDYNLKFDIELNIGGIIRQIRLIHITGEALATYDVIFRKQQIAPKMFISIQTGLIEIPNNFSNRMFELSATRPKIWLRGKWNYRLFDETMHNQVFSTEGIYNRRIGEYDYWDANFNYQIDGVTNPENDYRTVKAFGEDSVWKYPNGYQVILKNEGIIINKNLGLYFERKDYYHSVKRHFELTRMDEIYQEFLNSDEQTYRVVITPGGYEMYELYLQAFVKNFNPIKDRLLHIDIFYEHISDLIRD
jgi:hypothetical protein